jgi:hypothetical protein
MEELLFTLEFTPFVALAFVLYAIRRATKISKRYLPILAILLGVGFAIYEEKSFSSNVIIDGIQNAFYAVAIVFGAKYAQSEFTNRKSKKVTDNESNSNLNATNTTNNSSNSTEKTNVNYRY